jgi:hypothetical protein
MARSTSQLVSKFVHPSLLGMPECWAARYTLTSPSASQYGAACHDTIRRAELTVAAVTPRPHVLPEVAVHEMCSPADAQRCSMQRCSQS